MSSITDTRSAGISGSNGRSTAAAAAGPSGSPASQASELIAQARDPASGELDTQRLAGWVAQASQQDFGKASAAHAAIESELAGRDAGELARFNQDVVTAVAGLAEKAPTGLWAAGHALAGEGRRLLVDNPILVKQWESTTSAWTGKSGFTEGLRAMLQSHGITVERLDNPVPSGSFGKSSGVPASVANNLNGDLARDAIADRWRGQGLEVRIEQPRLGGARVVDVVVDRPAADPRQSQRLEIESKVGRNSLGSDLARQAALDGRALRENRMLRGAGQLLEGVGKVARPVGLVMDAVEVGSAFRKDGDRVGLHTGRAASGLAGGAAGGWGGAVGGAALGTAIFPGVGTVIGGVIGGIAGAVAGDQAGRGLFDKLKTWF